MGLDTFWRGKGKGQAMVTCYSTAFMSLNTGSTLQSEKLQLIGMS